MNINEIKKELYKQKPKANLFAITQHGIFYTCYINDGKDYIQFKVPFSDIGDANFYSEMDAKLLIRYIIHEKESL